MKKALIIVDVQNDFCDNGSLAVKGANEIIPIINDIPTNNYDLIILTQDYHPKNHKSFASNWNGKKVFDIVDLNGTPQVLWPDHCISYSKGSDFHPNLKAANNASSIIFPKGMNPEIDSYSGFYDNDKKTSTGLSEYLNSNEIQEVHICGLATDYCVKFTALDAVYEKFKTVLLLNACRGVFNLETEKETVQILKNAGVVISTKL